MSGHTVGSPAYRRITLALFLAGLATFALLYSTQPLLPTLAEHFGLSAAGSALSVSAATAGIGVALLVAGPVSEVLGRTRLMVASLVAAPMVGVVIALAPTWPVLLALRALQGVVLAGLPAVAMAYLSEELDSSSQARAAGVYVGGTALGAMLGRLLVGGVADLLGWRWALGAIAALGLICAAAVAAILPPSRNFTPAPRGLVHLVAQSKAILRDPALLALFGIGGAALGSFVAVFNAIGFRLESAPYHLSVGVAGLVYLSYSLGSVASPRAGALAARFGQRAVTPWAALVMVAGVAITLARPLALVALGIAVLTVGFFAVHGVASGWVAARASVGSGGTGQASSWYLFCYYLGSSVFGGLGGQAWQVGGWPAVAALSGGLAVVVVLVALVLRRIPSLLEPGRPRPAPSGF
ncbi:MAG: MFS transporter [Dermatophilaceae bacterium]